MVNYKLSNSIINFHSVFDPQWMEQVFLFLKSKYSIVPLENVYQNYFTNKSLKNSCHITFDDGDISFYNIVFPLLKKYQFPLSIYVSPTATIERKNFWFQEIRDYDNGILKNVLFDTVKLPAHFSRYPLHAIFKSLRLKTIWQVIDHYQQKTNTAPKNCMNMDVQQLKELHNSGLVAIGAHTQNHPILKNEIDDTARKEILSSVAQLSDLLGTKVEHFAYPNGQPSLDFTEREMKYLREAGIKIAFSTENKSFSKKDNPLAIPRNGLSYGSQRFVLFKLLMGNKWDLLKKTIKGKQEADWRYLLAKELGKNQSI